MKFIDHRGGDNTQKGGQPVNEVLLTKRRKVKNRPKPNPSTKGFKEPTQ